MVKDSKRSRKRPIRRLDQKALKYIIRQKGKKSASIVASEMKVSRDWIYKIWRQHTKTGQVPEPKVIGRPRILPDEKEIRKVLAEHAKEPAGVVRITNLLQIKNPQIPHWRVYQIMQNKNLITHSPTKSKRRKRVRYERKYSRNVACRLAYDKEFVPKRGQHCSLS